MQNTSFDDLFFLVYLYICSGSVIKNDLTKKVNIKASKLAIIEGPTMAKSYFQGRATMTLPYVHSVTDLRMWTHLYTVLKYYFKLLRINV